MGSFPGPAREGESLLPPDWRALAPLIDAVLDAAPDRRAALIVELAAGDPARQRALTHLVAECERDSPLLDRGAGERFDGLAGEEALLPDLLGDRYRIGRELGRGGMARVYLARDLKLGRDVAIKVIRPELSASLGHDRFLREIGIAARLRHPNIVPLHDSGEVGDSLYFVMPYEEGQSLRERLAQDGALPVSDAISVMRDVARALAYAHEHGVVHRDVKPDNVMLSGGAAVVTDFGIAKAVSAALTDASGPTLTQSGSAIGTPAYMAPEQATGDPATDHRADIYSFGCLAYELFTGKPPFASESMHLVIAAHIATVPQPVTALRAEVPPTVSELLARCLEKSASARPQSAREVLDALEGAATAGYPTPVSATVPALPSRARVLRWTGLALLAGVIMAGAYFATRGPASSPPIKLSLLPLGNTTADSAISYMAEGLPDEVASALMRVPGIQIMSRSGARYYQGQLGVDVTEAGTRLGADYLTTGMVRQERGQWILSLELERAADKASLWGERFVFTEARSAGAAFEIADKLTTALRSLFPNSIGSAAALPSSRASNTDAYRLYLIGKQQLNRRGQNITRSFGVFREAIALDTLAAEAYSGLSLALALAPRLQGLSPIPFTEATAAARRALLLNPRLSEPHVALGMLAEYALQWDLAESEYKTALALNSHDVEARIQYGHHLRLRSRPAESLKQYHLAREDDPGSAVVASHLSFAWFLQGQMDSALAESARAQQIDPTNLTTAGLGAQVLLAAGRPEEARGLIGNLSASNGIAMYILGKLGERDSVLERLRILENTRPTPRNVNTARASAMFALGDTARGLDALERATDAKELWFWGLGIGPMLDGVRESARHQVILRRVGLAR